MSQIGYGHGDPIGAPFDLYVGASQVVSNNSYTMQTGRIVLVPAAAVTGVTVTFPLNPPDGAVAEITAAGAAANTVSLTVAANTGDAIQSSTAGGAASGLGTPTVITPAASTSAGSAANTLKYVYSLNGSNGLNGNPGTAGSGARVWYRVQ